MMLSCRGGLQESPMLVSDLASARKFMGWPGTAGERREGWYHRGEAGEGVYQHRYPTFEVPLLPQKSSLKLSTALKRVMRFWMLPQCSPLFSFLFFSQGHPPVAYCCQLPAPTPPSSLLPMGKYF